jgi:hypothetical protein
MTKPRDHDLQVRVLAARDRSLAWLETMATPGQPKGVYRSAAAHDIEAWPQMLLPGTYNALMNLELIGGLGGLDETDRETLAAWITGFRKPDGVVRLPGMADADVFKKPDPAETWMYIDFHVTNYALGGLDAIGRLGDVPLDFAKPWLAPASLESWLAKRDLRDPWQEGNNIVNLASFLLLMRRDAALRARAETALDLLIDWHLRRVEPATGFWGVDQLSDPTRLLHAMAGAAHNYHLFYALRRPVPSVDKAVDYCLSHEAGVVNACIDVDIVDILACAYRLTDHRRGDIETWFRTFLPRLLDFQNTDGGFADETRGIRRFDGWVHGYEEPQGVSNTFATWFRWIAIAMMSEILWPDLHPWRFRRMIGIGYFGGAD